MARHETPQTLAVGEKEESDNHGAAMGAGILVKNCKWDWDSKWEQNFHCRDERLQGKMASHMNTRGFCVSLVLQYPGNAGTMIMMGLHVGIGCG